MILTNQMEEESAIVVELKNKEGVISQQRQRVEEITGELSAMVMENKRLLAENKRQ